MRAAFCVGFLAVVLTGCPGRPPGAGLVDGGTGLEPPHDAGPDVLEDPASPASFLDVLGFGGPGLDRVTGVAALADGVVVLSGTLTTTEDKFVQSRAGRVVVEPPTEARSFLAGFDGDGVFSWIIFVDGHVRVRENGGVRFAGTWDPAGKAQVFPELVLGQVDETGQLLWTVPLPGDLELRRFRADEGFATFLAGDFSEQSYAGLVGRVDVAAESVLWLRRLTTEGTFEGFNLGFGGIDETGRPVSTFDTASNVFLDGQPLVAATDVARGVAVAFDLDGSVRWTFVHDGTGSIPSVLRWATESPDGRLVLCGEQDFRADRTRNERAHLWVVRLAQETGELIDTASYAGPDVCELLGRDGEKLWMGARVFPRSSPSFGDVVFPLSGSTDTILVELDPAGRPTGVVPVATDLPDARLWAVGGGTIASFGFTDNRTTWLLRDGARSSLPIEDAHAVVLRAGPPSAPPFGPRPSSPHLRLVGGDGYDAANRVRLLEDGAVLVSGRFTTADDARAGTGDDAIPLAGDVDWSMGFLARFDADGTPAWALTVGAPFGVGVGFPITDITLSDDERSIFVVGNAGTGGGRFALGSADEVAHDGGFVARIDAATGALEWLAPREPFIDALAIAVKGGTLATVWHAPDEVVAVDPTTGATLWTRPLTLSFDPVPGVLIDGAGNVFAGKPLVAFSATGDSLWAAPGIATGANGLVELDAERLVGCVGVLVNPYPSSPPPVTRDDRADSVTVVIDKATGTVLRTEEHGPEGCAGLARDGDRIFMVDTLRDDSDARYGDVAIERKGFYDIVVAELDLDGQVIAARTLGGRGDERALALDARSGRVAVAGDSHDLLTLEDGTRLRPVRGDAVVFILEESP